MQQTLNTWGKFLNATIRYIEHNRVCGDDIEVFLVIEEKNQTMVFYRESFDDYYCVLRTFRRYRSGVDFETLFSWNQATIIRDTTYHRFASRRYRAQVLALLATRNALHEYLYRMVKKMIFRMF
jgi:hypothetical protein